MNKHVRRRLEQVEGRTCNLEERVAELEKKPTWGTMNNEGEFTPLKPTMQWSEVKLPEGADRASRSSGDPLNSSEWKALMARGHSLGLTIIGTYYRTDESLKVEVLKDGRLIHTGATFASVDTFLTIFAHESHLSAEDGNEKRKAQTPEEAARELLTGMGMYRLEVLPLSGNHTHKPSCDMTSDELADLTDMISELMRYREKEREEPKSTDKLLLSPEDEARALLTRMEALVQSSDANHVWPCYAPPTSFTELTNLVAENRRLQEKERVGNADFGTLEGGPSKKELKDLHAFAEAALFAISTYEQPPNTLAEKKAAHDKMMIKGSVLHPVLGHPFDLLWSTLFPDWNSSASLDLAKDFKQKVAGLVNGDDIGIPGHDVEIEMCRGTLNELKASLEQLLRRGYTEALNGEIQKVLDEILDLSESRHFFTDSEVQGFWAKAEGVMITYCSPEYLWAACRKLKKHSEAKDSGQQPKPTNPTLTVHEAPTKPATEWVSCKHDLTDEQVNQTFEEIDGASIIPTSVQEMVIADAQKEERPQAELSHVGGVSVAPELQTAQHLNEVLGAMLATLDVGSAPAREINNLLIQLRAATQSDKPGPKMVEGFWKQAEAMVTRMNLKKGFGTACEKCNE